MSMDSGDTVVGADHHQRTRWRALLAGVLIAVATAACSTGAPSAAPTTATTATGPSSASATPDPSAAALDEVKVTYLPITVLAHLFTAEEQGFFREERIRTSWTNINLYTVLPEISKGDQDVGIMATSAAFFNAITGGQDFRAVADRATYQCASDNHLVVRKALWDSGEVKTFADLKGKTIAILAKGSLTEYWNSILLTQYDMTEADLKGIVVLSYPDSLAALSTGAIDAVYLAEPTLSQAISQGLAVDLMPIYKVVPGEPAGQLIYSGKLIRERADVAQRFMNAYLKGVRFYLDPANKAAVVAATAKWTKLEPALLETIYGTDSWVWMNPNGTLQAQQMLDNEGKWMLDNKLVDKLPAVSDFYDDTFIKQAVQQLGEVDATRTCA